jgi:hypothetical protein
VRLASVKVIEQVARPADEQVVPSGMPSENGFCVREMWNSHALERTLQAILALLGRVFDPEAARGLSFPVSGGGDALVLTLLSTINPLIFRSLLRGT